MILNYSGLLYQVSFCGFKALIYFLGACLTKLL